MMARPPGNELRNCFGSKDWQPPETELLSSRSRIGEARSITIR
jgi:hypothetical protein